MNAAASAALRPGAEGAQPAEPRPQQQSAAERERPEGAVVLAVVANVAAVVLEPRQRGRFLHAAAQVVDDLGGGGERQPPALPPQPQAQVHVLLVQEEAFVE